MREKVGVVLKRLANIFVRVLNAAGSPRTIVALVVTLSFIIALTLRAAPMKWGVYLNEFDPFYEYYLAEKLLEKGNGDVWKGIAWWFGWWFDPRREKDTLFWAPYGRDLRRTSQPGAAMFSALTYVFMTRVLGLEVDLYTVHAFIPVVGAATASIAIFFLGRELRDDVTGALASLALSVSWAFIYRTNLGAKHEGLAVPFMILAFWAFLKACRAHTTRSSLLWSILAGIFLGGVVLSWGAYLYPWNLLALVTLAWLIFNPTDRKVALAFVPANITAVLFIAVTPRFGPRIALFSVGAVLPLTATIVSLLSILGVRVVSVVRERSRQVVAATALGLLAALLVLWQLGLLSSLPGRILAVVVPLWREVGVTTVAEHMVPTWAMLFGDYLSLIVFSFAGALALLGRRDLKSFFAFLFWFSSLYAASSMARLTLLFAPAVTLVGAIGVVHLCETLLSLPSAGKRFRRKRRGTISREVIAFAVILILLSLAPAIIWSPAIATRAGPLAHQPPLILTSSVGVLDYDYRYMDWISALEWIKANVPKDAIIATWWDYGYWISINTRRKTTCDNATINATQIRLIARAFLSNETVALRIFKKLGVKYVVVYEPFFYVRDRATGLTIHFSLVYGGVGGDLAKSAQMARWIGLDPDRFNTVATLEVGGRAYPVLVPADTPEARNATLYRMLFTKTSKKRLFVFEPIMGRRLPQYRDGPLVRLPPLKHFRLVFESEPNGWVMVFEVVYPSERLRAG